MADYYPNADYNFQVVEGIISPLPVKGIDIHDHSAPGKMPSARDLGQKLFCYPIQPNGKIERGHSFSAISISMLYAWEHRLWMAGIPTVYTINWTETARRLVIIYRNEQKAPEEHSTLHRVIKPKVAVRDENKMTEGEKSEYHLMKALMFLSDAYHLGIGDKRARALCSRYVNLIDLAMADPKEIAQCEDMGIMTAKKLLKALGRSEI